MLRVRVFPLSRWLFLLTLSLGFLSLTSLISLQRKNSDLGDIITPYIPLVIVLPSLIFKGNFILRKSTCLLKHCCFSWNRKKKNPWHFSCKWTSLHLLCDYFQDIVWYCVISTVQLKLLMLKLLSLKKSLWVNTSRLYYTTVCANLDLVL